MYIVVCSYTYGIINTAIFAFIMSPFYIHLCLAWFSTYLCDVPSFSVPVQSLWYKSFETYRVVGSFQKSNLYFLLYWGKKKKKTEYLVCILVMHLVPLRPETSVESGLNWCSVHRTKLELIQSNPSPNAHSVGTLNTTSFQLQVHTCCASFLLL